MSKRFAFRLWIAAGLLAASSACSSSNSTALVVTVEVDQALLSAHAISQVHGTVSATNHGTVPQELPAQSTQIWQINPQDVAAPFEVLVTVTGQLVTDGGAPRDVVTDKKFVRIVPGARSTATLTLTLACEDPATGPRCNSDQTCTAGACVPIPHLGGGADGGAGAGGRAGAAGGNAGTGGGAGAGAGGQGGKPKLNAGDPCLATSDCASGVCSSADKVCCDSDCAGSCESCLGAKTNKANGVCNPLPAGSNADNDCAPSANACGTTGSCDGNRKCALAAATTPCAGTSSCSGGQLTVTPAACDGAGTCVPGTASVSACPGGVACMSATACLPTTCTADGSCSGGTYCDLGTHTCSAKKALGGACSGTNQCASGFCADGVCCTNACGGTCEACIQTKTGVADGHCAAVTSGTDPDSECAADGTSCGHTGLCDHNGGSGGGACAYAATGSTCAGTFSCTGSGVTSSTTGSCDGAGACKQSAPAAGTCGGYICGSTTTCQNICTSPAECVSGYGCIGGLCMPSTFKTGPCVTTPDNTAAVVFALGSDGRIHQKAASNGTTFGAWTTLSLDASGIDARSDLDCSANADVTHIVATGNNPGGALLHATGSGTTFNPFFRELTTMTFAPPGAAIKAYPVGNSFVLGAFNAFPILYDVQGSTYTALQPFTTYSTTITSSIDVGDQSFAGSAVRIVVGFDSSGKLDLYNNQIDSSGAAWLAPLIIAPPSGTTYQYSPTICTDTGAMGGTAAHLAVVAGGSVWDAYDANGSGGPFSAWEKAGTGAAGAVDCTMLGDGTLHIVTLSAAGHVLDVHGKPGSWTTSDLGVF